MKMLRALAVSAALLLPASAFAGVTTFTITQGAGTTFDAFTDGSSHLFGATGLYGVAGDYQVDATAYGLLVDTSSSSEIAALLQNPPNLAITGPATAAWTGITPGGTAASTIYAGDVNIAGINGKTILTGAGATGTGSQRVTVAEDANTIAGSAATMSHASTTALGTSLVAKNSAGNLGAYNCTAITGGAAGFCVAYNATSAPSTGALTGSLVLDYCYFDTTARGCSLSRLPNNIAFSTGIVILATSAASPYTYTTGTDTAALEADYQ